MDSNGQKVVMAPVQQSFLITLIEIDSMKAKLGFLNGIEVTIYF